MFRELRDSYGADTGHDDPEPTCRAHPEEEP